MSTSGSVAGGDRSSSRQEARADDTKGPAKPDYYYGDRNKLEDWFNQLQIYFIFHQTANAVKTVYASSYLRGRAQHYFKPLLSAYLQDRTDSKGVFTNFNAFKAYMKEVFGITNEETAAVRVIQSLRQKTSAAEYTARFREYANLTDWEGSALMTMYRRGLKENVKDELMRSGGEHNNLEQLVTDAIDIDDKLYERAMEKRHILGRGTYALPGRSGGGNRGDPMELDATSYKRSKNGRKGGFGKRKKAGDMKCYACDKPGHIAKNCRSKNQVQKKQFNVMRKADTDVWPDDKAKAEMKNPDHATASWTACYYDYCSVHLSDKQGSGWFPAKPRRQLNVIERRPRLRREAATLHEEPEPEATVAEVPETPVMMTPPMTENDLASGSTTPWPEEFYEDDFKDEESSIGTAEEGATELEENPEELLFNLEGNEMVRRITTYIASQQSEMFPNDGIYLDPHAFDVTMDYVRSMVWIHPRIEVEYDAASYITERPPVGSTFNCDGSYVTPDGVVIPRAIRQEVDNLRMCYRKCADIQKNVQSGMTRELAQRRLTTVAGQYHSNHTFPQVTETPLWKGRIPPGLQAEFKGRVSLRISGTEIIIRPRDIRGGPLDWEVRLDFAELESQSEDSGNE